MVVSLSPLPVRRILGRDEWAPPIPFGPDGWQFLRKDQTQALIFTVAEHEDAVQWIHASIANMEHVGAMPTYEDLSRMHRAVFGAHRYAYQVFAPVREHVNIHGYALHLWGRLDGTPALPEFNEFGSI